MLEPLDAAVEAVAELRWAQIKGANNSWPDFGDGTAFDWDAIRDEARGLLQAALPIIEANLRAKYEEEIEQLREMNARLNSREAEAQMLRRRAEEEVERLKKALATSVDNQARALDLHVLTTEQLRDCNRMYDKGCREADEEIERLKGDLDTEETARANDNKHLLFILDKAEAEVKGEKDRAARWMVRLDEVAAECDRAEAEVEKLREARGRLEPVVAAARRVLAMHYGSLSPSNAAAHALYSALAALDREDSNG